MKEVHHRHHPVTPYAKQQFLDTYDEEHATTMKVLRGYPTDKLDLRPHAMCKTAPELAWMFVLERRLGAGVFNNAFASGRPSGELLPAPESWDAILGALEKAHKSFGDLVRSTPEDKLGDTVRFFIEPGTLGDWSRLKLAWFLLHDQIHSIYLRMAGGKVPSIYGPIGRRAVDVRS